MNDEVSTGGEAFIPFVRQDLVEMCLTDGALAADHRPAFRRLTELLTATVHLEFLHISDEVKRHYAPFDPDRQTKLLDNSEEIRAASRERILKVFHSIARRANCFEIDREQIREYIDSPTLIELRTTVDLELLFPNVKVGMKLKEKLMFGVPAIGGPESRILERLTKGGSVREGCLRRDIGYWMFDVGVIQGAALSRVPVTRSARARSRRTCFQLVHLPPARRRVCENTGPAL